VPSIDVEDERKPVARPVPRAPSPEVRPVPAAAPAPAAAARELCADASFFSRPMCLHQECQKAENMSLPVCVEARKRATETPQTGSP
jgi:hypothetical protein